MHQQSRILYRVVDKNKELDSVTTIKFVLDKDSTVPTFIPGQYIDIYVEDQNTTEGKSYSISSSPEDSFLSITVKEMGQFSKYLANLNIGDVIQASEPYGYFYTENNQSNLIFVIAGISITPAMSMIRYLSKSNPERKLNLFYSNSFENSILFKNELDEIVKNNSNIKVTHFITKESVVHESYETGRITPSFIVKEINNIFSDGSENEYFICGSITFVRDMWDGFREAGVNEEQIYTEAFFSH